MKAKLTEELIETIIGLKRSGLSNKDICQAVGIHEATLYRWINKPTNKLHRALSEELKKAEASYKETLLDTIKKAALTRNSYWTAAAWLLERKYPDEYGRVDRRAERSDTTDVPQIVLGIEVRKAEGDQAEENTDDHSS